jgi:hypothetical protein
MAGVTTAGAISPVALGARFHVHSHARPLIPGTGKVRPHQMITLPETPGPHAKQPG